MPHNHAEHHHHDPADDAGLAAMLDLDARVLDGYWTTALELVAAHAPDGVRRVVDLGAGTGTAAIAFAQRWPDADVVAVDASEAMLTRLAAKSSRVRCVQADLDAGWPIDDTIDVTWASNSLHHLSDPAGTLQQAFAGTRPGGILAVAEFAAPPRFLPDDLGMGRPGLEQRCADRLAEQHRHDLPELGADWPTKIGAAGFEVLEHRDLVLDEPLLDDDGRQYAEAWMRRLVDAAGDDLDDDDRATVVRLFDAADDRSLHRRTDLHIRGVRSVTIARRA